MWRIHNLNIVQLQLQSYQFHFLNLLLLGFKLTTPFRENKTGKEELCNSPCASQANPLIQSVFSLSLSLTDWLVAKVTKTILLFPIFSTSRQNFKRFCYKNIFMQNCIFSFVKILGRISVNSKQWKWTITQDFVFNVPASTSIACFFLSFPNVRLLWTANYQK